MNRKREVTGNRVPRKKVNINGEEIEIFSGDTSKLDNKERKLLAELEEGGQEYQDRSLWEMVARGGKRKPDETDEAAVAEVAEVKQLGEMETRQNLKKRQKLMTEYLVDQEQVEMETGRMPEAQVQIDESEYEVQVLRETILEDRMAQKGAKAMERSHRSRRKAKDMFHRYSSNYRKLAEAGDRAMVKAWREANKVRENWMGPERLQTITEEEEPPPDPSKLQPEDTDEAPGEVAQPGGQESSVEGQGAQKTKAQGRVKRLTEYFNKIGGPRTPRGPITPKKPPKTQGGRGKTSTPASGGITKTRRKSRPKIDENERCKLELAMKSFLKKKPPD